MGFMNKVFDVMGFVETEVNDEQEIMEQPSSRQSMPTERKNAEIRPISSAKSNLVTMQPREVSVVNNHHNSGANAKMVLVAPMAFDETQNIADNLLKGRAVVINIEDCDPDIAAKIIDFVGGVVYAINGSIQKVSQGIILAAPENIDISSELRQQLADEQTEVFSWVTRYNNRSDF